MTTYVCVELTDEAGEVVVFEVVGQKISRELRRSPDNESVVVITPRDDIVSGRVIDELVRLGQERCRHRLLRVER